MEEASDVPEEVTPIPTPEPLDGMRYLTQAHLDELEISYEEALATVAPTILGKTWATDEDGDWLIPKLTLGWQIAEWCTRKLRNPDGTGPWRFTNEQLRYILWFYAIDRTGQFLYRESVLQRLKGWG